MKVSRIVKLVLAAVCFLLVSSTVVAKEEVSWTLDDYDYSLMRQWNVGEFYGRTSVDVTYDVQTSMGYLQIDGGHLREELFVFSVSVYEADKWGSGESIWHKNFETIQANIPFSQIREWNLAPGEYLISVAAKTWGEDASLDMYDLCVSENSGGNTGAGDNIGGENDSDEIITPDGEVIIKPDEGGTDTGSSDVTDKIEEDVSKPTPTPEKEKVIKPGKVSIQTAKRIAAKKAKLVWKKVKGDGIRYEVQYSTTKKFKKKDTVTKTLKKTSLSISKLNKSKKYYVRVRAYKVVNGEKVYGSYSKVKTISKWKK